MPGHNHFDGCTCGWCQGGWRNHETLNSRFAYSDGHAPNWPGYRATFESYTDPNAVCPVCGEQVFFYRSPYGGRVFFDELGPPWPKHPCTDNTIEASTHRSLSSRRVGNLTRSTRWQKTGWIPVRVSETYRANGEWRVVVLQRLDTKTNVTRVLPSTVRLSNGLPALMLPLDQYGVGRLSWLAEEQREGADVEVVTNETWLNYRGFNICDFSVFEAARAGDIEAMFSVGWNLGWLGHDEATPTVRRQPRIWHNFDFARAWLSLAAQNGSDVARDTLENGDPDLGLDLYR